jgi:hypothetical protein
MMSFNYEYQMVAPAEQWLRSQGLTTKREFSTPWGICDLVGCSLNRKKARQRLTLGQTKPIGPQIRIIILSYIPDIKDEDSITLENLQQKFAGYFDETKIALEVYRLVRDKFVQITPCGKFQKINGWAPLQNKIVALELKLTRITNALHQAINNLELANESYVGLPMENAQRLIKSKKKTEFVQRGIGIIGVNTKRCRIFLEPNPSRSNQNRILQMHCVERFWRTHFKSN